MPNEMIIRMGDISADALMGDIRQQTLSLCQKYITTGQAMLLAKQGPSSPGEVPGFQSGTLARSLRFRMFNERQVAASTIIAEIFIDQSAYYGKYLESGTRQMLPRPFVKQIAQAAWGFV